MFKKSWTAAALATCGIAGLVITDAVHAASSNGPKASCESLAGLQIAAGRIRLPTSGAKITSAKPMPAEGDPASPNYLPAYCDVRGEIAPVDVAAGVINFGVALPMQWNGNAMQIGGNGMLGFIPWLAALSRNGAGSPTGPVNPPDKPYPLAMGYVTYGDDSGHKFGTGMAPGQPGGVPEGDTQATRGGAPPPEAARAGGGAGGAGGAARGGGAPSDPLAPYGWATNRETWLNFTYEHIRKGHDAAMAVVQAYYGRAPRYNYFFGESHGGREAMQAVARYPEDYKGVSMSVPLTYLTELFLIGMRDQRAQLAEGAWFPPAKLRAIETETLRQCDELDGLKDGLVLNYAGCRAKLDPVTNPNAMTALRCAGGADTGDTCLSDAQIATLNTMRSPVKLPYALYGGAREYPGQPIGAEATLNFPTARVKPDPQAATSPFLPLFRAVFNDPSLTLQTFDFDRLSAKLKAFSDDLDAPTDWSRFLNRGGKVIFHTASDDYTTNANAHFATYEAVIAQASKAAVQKGLRAYVTPSGDHGSRSFTSPERVPQARMSDLIGTLTAWVERGKQPPAALRETLTALTPPYAVSRARPLCQYPNYPRYKGSGDAASFDSYACSAP